MTRDRKLKRKLSLNHEFLFGLLLYGTGGVDTISGRFGAFDLQQTAVLLVSHQAGQCVCIFICGIRFRRPGREPVRPDWPSSVCSQSLMFPLRD